MPELPLGDIVEFIEHLYLLNDKSLSDMQRMILKSIYGLDLNRNELEMYYACTGRTTYEPREQIEVTIIAGRRSGKTSKIAAPIAIFEAFRKHGLPHNEEAYVVLLAPQIAQARIAFRSIRRYLHNSRVLSKRIIRETKEEISFDNGITIACYPCSYVAVRGVTIIAVICDEMAFWPHDASAANPEEEILGALHPAMANVKNAKLIKISTPFRKQGILWTERQRRAELDYPVFQVPTFLMNPTISAAELERYRKKGEQKFLREFMATFSENITSWIDPEILDPCIVRGRKELPRVPGVYYVAAIDPAFSHDDFALCIAHMLADGTIVLDLLVRWRGTKSAPLGFERVLQEIKYYLDRYGIVDVHGDLYCAPVIRQQLLKLGIFYQDFRIGSHTKAEIYGNLKHIFIQRKIELLDDPELLEEFRNLEERAMDGGRVEIKSPGKKRDDLADVVAMCAYELSKQHDFMPAPQLGIIETSRTRFPFTPHTCPVASICMNFPDCLDKGSCQGFRDERVNGFL
jgi:hypothetical protein